jgi:hypothetical protein
MLKSSWWKYHDSYVRLSVFTIRLSKEQSYNFPMIAKQETRIERQIEKIKRDLVALGDLRPGSLSTQYNVCGTPRCRCKASPPEKHGPYYQISFARNGKSSFVFRGT